MNLYQRFSEKGEHQIAAFGHVDEFDFSQACKEKHYKIEPGSVKLVYEAMRRVNKTTKFIRCSKFTFGAKELTIATLNN